MDATIAALTPCLPFQTFDVTVEAYNPDKLPPEATMAWTADGEVPSCMSIFNKTVKQPNNCYSKHEVGIFISSPTPTPI